MMLTIFLISGLLIEQPISRNDCHDLIETARLADGTGAILSHDLFGEISALKCDGRAVVLSLPPATGDCGETS